MATSLEALAESINELHQRLDAVPPDPERQNWDEDRAEINAIDRFISQELLPALREGRELIEDAEERTSVDMQVGFLLGEFAALLHISNVRDPRSIMSEAVGLSGRAPMLEAARAEPDMHAAIVHGQWLLRNGQGRAAQKTLARVAKTATSEALKEAAKASADAPQPMKNAPSMFTFNTIGTGLYGKRDVWEDGTYVATLCFCVLFMPLFPISAYRVFSHGSGEYTFFSKQRLSGFARGARALMAATSLAAVIGFTTSVYLESPTRLASVALDEARAQDRAGNQEEAIASYEKLLDQHLAAMSDADAQEAGSVLAKAYTAGIPSPLTPEQSSHAQTAASRFGQLPARARGGAAFKHISATIQRWVDELGASTNDRAQSSLRLLEIGMRLAPVTERGELQARQSDLRLAMAEAAAKDWPLESLALLFDDAGNSRAVNRTAELLMTLASHPLLLASVATPAGDWLGQTRSLIPAEQASAIEAALADAAAKTTNEARKALFEKPEAKALLAHTKQAPWDQQATVELAAVHYGRGELKQAVKLLSPKRGPGWLVPQGQHLLASVHMARGELKQAETILKHLLAARAPQYRAASKAWTEHAQRAEQVLIARLRKGSAPQALYNRLDAANEADQNAMIGTWLREELGKNARLKELAQRAEAVSDVVPVSLALGMVRLRRANAAEGAAREELLGQAERAYLAVREEASGMPSFHLGLGQVYHRLGKTADGERELKTVLANPDPQVRLSVVSIYRDLGLVKRATEEAETIYKNEDSSVRQEAAWLLSFMAPRLEEKEQWLSRANQNSEQVKFNLLDVRAQQALRAGRYSEADKLLAKVAAYHETSMSTDPAGANNAALAYQGRYTSTGVRKHLVRANELLESALRLSPESGIVVKNLTEAVLHRGHLEVLDRWVNAKRIPLSSDEASDIYDVLVDSSLRNQVRAAATENRSLLRARALIAQEQALSPGSASAYQHELALLSEEQDPAKLKAFADRVANINQFDHSRRRRAMEQWRSGASDPQALVGFEALLTRYAALAAKLDRLKTPRELAVVRWLEARTLRRRATITNSLEDLGRSVESYEESERLWPNVGLGNSLATALIQKGLTEAAKTSPAMAEQHKEDSRIYPTYMMLHRTLEGPHKQVIVARPELARAAMLRRSRAAKDPTINDWILARATGDAELKGAADKVFKDEFKREVARLEALIYDAESATEIWEIFRSH